MAEHVGRVIVSTDGEDIAAAAREVGADVPFMRPQLLATDTATSESVLVHALQWLEENGDSSDIIVYLQPTEPFRSPGMIDNCAECLIRDPSVDSAFMAAIDHKNYWREDAAGLESLAASQWTFLRALQDKANSRCIARILRRFGYTCM